MVAEVIEKPKALVKHAELAFYVTPEEAARITRFKGAKIPRVRPDAIYVIAIGTSWEPGAWQKVMDMVAYTNEHGFACWFKEIEDSMSQLPYAAINPMRNDACMTAVNSGCEWLLLVENDILPEPDLLLKLMNWNAPVVFPYCIDEETGKPLASPTYKPNIGLQPLQWAVFSCILMKTNVLHCFPECAPFKDVLRESWFFNKLVYYGHQGHVDTNTPLKLATKPTYGGNNSGVNDLWKFYEKADERRRRIPNRKPIDPDCTSLIEEVYIPQVLIDKMKKND